MWSRDVCSSGLFNYYTEGYNYEGKNVADIQNYCPLLLLQMLPLSPPHWVKPCIP